MIDDYLKDVNSSLDQKKSIVAAYQRVKMTKNNVYIYLNDGVLVCIAKNEQITKVKLSEVTSIHECKKINQNNLNELLFKLQVVNFLSIGKQNLWSYQWYQKRLCNEWLSFHPHFSVKSLMEDAKKLPTKYIDKVTIQSIKTAIFTKQVCHVCFATSVQMCAVCGITHYCSSECQRNDWQKHKITCCTF